MPRKHTYTLSGTWTDNPEGVGHIHLAHVDMEVGLSPRKTLASVSTSPEELLLGAAASCYLITLAKLLHNRGIPYTKLELTSEGLLENDGGLRLDCIHHRPTIHFQQPVAEDAILALANHAEHACMVSSALRGNVIVTVEAKVRVHGIGSQI